MDPAKAERETIVAWLNKTSRTKWGLGDDDAAYLIETLSDGIRDGVHLSEQENG